MDTLYTYPHHIKQKAFRGLETIVRRLSGTLGNGFVFRCKKRFTKYWYRNMHGLFQVFGLLGFFLKMVCSRTGGDIEQARRISGYLILGVGGP